MGVLEDILAEFRSINQTLKELPMGISKVVLQFKAVGANADPQYVGELNLGTLIVGQPVVLRIMDPDGDPVTATLSLPDEVEFTLTKANDGSQNHILTLHSPVSGPNNGFISAELTMDDGK